MAETPTRKTLIILNDPPYGTDPADEVRIFLLGDAVAGAKTNQQTPNGYYNLERMMAVASRQGASVGVCGSCMDARGMAVAELAEGAHRGSMDELADWTRWADKVVVF